MRSAKLFSLSILLSGITMFSSSCKKEDTAVDPVESNNLDPVNVLVDGSGFSHVYDDVMTLSSATTLEPSLGILDYTLETNGNLNIVYYSRIPTQQSVMETNKRVTKNLSSGQMIPLPAGASKLEYNGTSIYQNSKQILKLQMFRPYSNFFTYASQFDGSFGYNNTCNFAGDIGCSISSANPIGMPDLGYRFPCMNFSVNKNDNGFGYFAQGIPKPTYTLSGTSVLPFGTSSGNNKILRAILESDIYTYGNYKAFIFRPDSVIAYNVNDNASAITMLIGVSISLDGNSSYDTYRHYTTDGKIMGLLLQNTSTKTITTISYDFNTGAMTKGLENILLPYSGEGTDFDLDEFGNVYYTGFAGNGSILNGVSIYKRSTNGEVSLIGKDNLLKFGQVIKLKTLNGKIFIALTGKKTGTSNYQISILKED